MEFRNTAFNADCFDILAQLPDGCVDMVLTDPPYAISDKGYTANDWDVGWDIKRWWAEIWRVCKPTANVVFTSCFKLTSAMMQVTPYIRQQLIWVKSQGTQWFYAPKMHLPAHEEIMVAYRKLGTFNPQKHWGGKYAPKARVGESSNYGAVREKTVTESDGYRFPTSVLKFNSIKNAFGSVNGEVALHPTQKPLSLWNYLIRSFSDEGDLVLDTFAGAGTTAVACIQTGRDYCIIEKSNELYNKEQTVGYFDVCLRRIAEAEYIPPPYKPQIKDQIKLF